jgi:hypothetical protein
MSAQYQQLNHITNRRRSAHNGADFFPTPKWATYALLDNEKFEGDIWEPACGNGAMARVLGIENNVLATDLDYRGYGQGGVDFLKNTNNVDNIVTNPPYNLAEEFVHQGIKRSRYKLALLLRMAFVESASRHRTLFSKHPPSRLWAFTERITFYPGGVKTAGSGTTAYAWFVWDKAHDGATELCWLKPGYKAEYG